MTTLTWLHLSDWHQRGPDFGRQVVRDALLKDLRERDEIDHTLARLDFAVFSGDAAFYGKPAEYETAQKCFFDPVLEAVGLDPDHLFIVPGNHDLDRETVYEMLPVELQKPLESDEQVQAWLTNEKKRRRLLEPFEAYSRFVASYTGQQPPDYASVRR
jgi:hypothetical protein